MRCVQLEQLSYASFRKQPTRHHSPCRKFYTVMRRMASLVPNLGVLVS